MAKMIRVADIMTPNPITVQPTTKLDEVIGLMKTHHFRHLLVVDNQQVIGIISDRDVRLVMNSPLVQLQPKKGWKLLNTVRADGCMTPNPLTIGPNATAGKAAELMNHYKFDALPVIKEGRLVGIVTVSDILKSYSELTT
jgi:acetoin utilization protein AcuB